MYEYLKGQITQLEPTRVVVEAGGLGYGLFISLQTYSRLQGLDKSQLWLHHILREDEEALYGFATRGERELFRLLISVSGLGPRTAQLILSSMSCEELQAAIIGDDLHRLKGVKGIGLKTAQRMVVELRDKMLKLGKLTEADGAAAFARTEVMEEAGTALTLLGFPKNAVDKVLKALIQEDPSLGLETLIKAALKRL